MRYLSFLALALAIAITTALVVASGEQDPPHVSDGPPRFAMIHAAESTTTSTLAYVLDSWVGVDYDEVQELAATIRSVETTTTTTTLPAPPTTKASSTGSAQPKPTTTTAPPQPAGGFHAGHESDFYRRINSLRTSNDLPSLAHNGSLDSFARARAKDMAQQGELDRHKGFGLPSGWREAGENIGRGGSVDRIWSKLAESSGHRSNMLRGSFTHVGIGVWVDGNGHIWTAHVFAG